MRLDEVDPHVGEGIDRLLRLRRCLDGQSELCVVFGSVQHWAGEIDLRTAQPPHCNRPSPLRKLLVIAAAISDNSNISREEALERVSGSRREVDVGISEPLQSSRGHRCCWIAAGARQNCRRDTDANSQLDPIESTHAAPPAATRAYAHIMPCLLASTDASLGSNAAP